MHCVCSSVVVHLPFKVQAVVVRYSVTCFTPLLRTLSGIYLIWRYSFISIKCSTLSPNSGKQLSTFSSSVALQYNFDALVFQLYTFTSPHFLHLFISGVNVLSKNDEYMIYFYRCNIQHHMNWTDVAPSFPLKCCSHIKAVGTIIQWLNTHCNKNN